MLNNLHNYVRLMLFGDEMNLVLKSKGGKRFELTFGLLKFGDEKSKLKRKQEVLKHS